MADTSSAQRLMQRLEAFARHTDDGGRLTRLYLSPAHKAAAEELVGWMREAGLSVEMDALGTVRGRYEATTPGAPALLIGSHIDTVRDAGRYDGTLGVLAGLAAVEELGRKGERFPFAIEVIAFGDEENIRFPTTLMSSRALTGDFDARWLDARDEAGVRVADALLTFGGNPQGVAGLRRERDSVLAYVEMHIEQGPVLEAEGLPVGIVSVIAGSARHQVTVTGFAGHAGTVPMHLRRDAGTAAAEMLLAVERCATSCGIVATVGRLVVEPGASNVIPGLARFTIDIRAPIDEVRRVAFDDLRGEMEAIAARRGVGLDVSRMFDVPATACSPVIVAGLEASVARVGITPRQLPSGAGHDAMAMARLCPMGMLFVRCKEGISHNPAESITADDADVVLRVLLDFVRAFAPERLRSG
ncbi:MAG: allantoate amidohydrolase [Hyphomicrobiaceae bacterium]